MQNQWKNVSVAKCALMTAGSMLRRNKVPSVKRIVRCYTIQPPDWLGGKNILIKSGRYTFPEHEKTFEEKMKRNYYFLLSYCCICHFLKIRVMIVHVVCIHICP